MDSEQNSEIEQNGEKVIVIGDSSVGKTSILNRYINDKFSDNLKPTIGCDHYEKELTLDGKKIKLSIWDTAGQERFRGLAASYYKRAKCVILVFDITKRESFERLDFWRDELMNFGEDGILVVCIGNKSDLQEQRTVTPDEIQTFVKKHGYFYMETSALQNSDKNIEKVFEHVAETLLKSTGDGKTVKNNKINKGDKEVKLDGENEPKKDGESGGCKC
jgi:small GTP-binding protein